MTRRIVRVIAIGLAAGTMNVAPAAGPMAFQQEPQTQQKPAEADPFVFDADRILVIIRVAEAAGIEFEVTMGKVKEVLAKSEKPERKEQAAHWKLIKAQTPQDGELTYFFLIDRVVRGASYDPFKILPEGLSPEEVGELFKRVAPAIKSISAAPLAPIISMAPPGGGGA